MLQQMMPPTQPGEIGDKAWQEYTQTLTSTTIECGFKPKYVFIAYYIASNTYRVMYEVYDESVSTTQIRFVSQGGSSMVNKGTYLFSDVTDTGFTITSTASRTLCNLVCVG